MVLYLPSYFVDGQYHSSDNFFPAGSESKLKDGLPQECLKACDHALSVLQNICKRMQKRSITVNELQKITNNYEQMIKLCEVATIHGSNKHLLTKAVDSALEELTAFEEHRSHLFHLCKKLPNVQGKCCETSGKNTITSSTYQPETIKLCLPFVTIYLPMYRHNYYISHPQNL